MKRKFKDMSDRQVESYCRQAVEKWKSKYQPNLFIRKNRYW